MSSVGWEAILYLEKGHLYEGLGFGARQTGGGEAVFNTGMAGYQEIFSDPSYSNQVVVMTSAHIGNTGVNRVDIESEKLHLGGMVVREYVDEPSSWRSEETLSAYCARFGVAGISEVDTREITTLLRDEGAQRAVVFPKELAKGAASVESFARDLIAKVPEMEGLDLVSLVSCQTPYEFDPVGSNNSNPKGTIVVYDYGVKTHILRSLRQRDFRVWVVPYNLPHQEALNYKPDAIVLSNGPGDPAKVPGSVREIQSLLGKKPILGICMGHQLLARALGGNTYKLKFGHHGVNHPVKDLTTGRILITSQNHGFSIEADSFKGEGVQITHTSLNDHTVEGFSSKSLRCTSVQFHPEAAPGPSDASYIFDTFIRGFLQ